ncbi:hypothetical protein [Novosphingobium album (ex Hu et al. 2023)]|uniref:Uncharacterized protein n=1 Tax=Novosphingobium album (ex Hu et al. 2023) TaxID=2930093 RepID=A0ABT0B4H4_9SPHN|nr:hypothetical protein [Novosphingobium album (ex Hu et al. 2023)]MCJ2179784.1 hypothetical protein [Novosphingobium album (ex Hu et al. 2023)]
MTRLDDLTKIYWHGIQDALTDNSAGVDFRQFSAISQRFLSEYKQLETDGLPGQTIALAMLGATLNLCNIFGGHEQLPMVLRNIADRIDNERNIH